MSASNVMMLALWIVGIIGFVTGVVCTGAIVWIETRKRKSPRTFVGFDYGKDDDCTVYGHYDVHGDMHIDRVEYQRRPTA
jgi:hypothetical protein